MTDFEGLVIFAVVLTLIVSISITCLYCGCIMLCKYLLTKPLAESEIPV